LGGARELGPPRSSVPTCTQTDTTHGFRGWGLSKGVDTERNEVRSSCREQGPITYQAPYCDTLVDLLAVSVPLLHAAPSPLPSTSTQRHQTEEVKMSPQQPVRPACQTPPQCSFFTSSPKVAAACSRRGRRSERSSDTQLEFLADLVAARPRQLRCPCFLNYPLARCQGSRGASMSEAKYRTMRE
jgi:hypothetical protein